MPKINPRNRVLLFSVISSALSSFIIFLCISTVLFKIIFSIVFFVFILLLQLTLFDKNSNRLPSSSSLIAKNYYFVFLLAFLGTIIVLVANFHIEIAGKTIWDTFTSLSLLGVARVLFGYFLVCFFPGYVLIKNLNVQKSNVLENIGLSLAFSFVISNVIGLILFKVGLQIDALSILFSIWVFALVTAVTGRIFRSRFPSKAVPNIPDTSLLQYAVLLCVSASLVFSFYVTTMNASPFTGVLCSDIPDYMNALNRFLISNSGVRLPYPTWVAFNAWIVHKIVNLPLLHTYAGFQFYIFLIPMSAYFLCKSLFASHGKAAVITTALISITGGLISLTIPFVNGMDYFSDPGSLLHVIQNKIGLRSFATFHINGYTTLHVSTFEGAFWLLSLAFAYRYFKTKNSIDLILCSILISSALFSHSIMLFLCFAVAITMYSLAKKFYRELIKICLVTSAFLVFFDFLSNNFFQNLFSAYYLTFFVGPFKITISPNQLLIPVLIISLIPLSFVLFRRYGISLKIFIHRLGLLFYERLYHYALPLLWILGFAIVFLSLFLWGIGSSSFSLTSTSTPYPWYFQIIYYGIIFLFAIGTFSIVLKKVAKSPLLFLGCIIASILLAGCLAFVVPEIFKLQTWALRLTYALAYPMASLAALGIYEVFRFFKLKSNVRVAHLSMALLIIIMVPSFLSYSYDTEFWSYNRLGRLTKNGETLEWMYNNLPADACVLTLSEKSYEEVINLASLKSIPLLSLKSWPHLILSRSELPEDVLCILANLGVTHIYLSENDNEIQGYECLFSILDCFNLVHETDSARVFEVPKYPLYSDSSYVLVNAVFDTECINYLNAFRMFLRTGLNFSVISDTDLDSLLPSSVYFFPCNQKLPRNLVNELIPAVRAGSNVVFMSPDFATMNLFGSTVTFDDAFVNQIESLDSDYATAYSMVLDGGQEIALDEGVTIRRIYVDESKAKILSYYKFSGQNVPLVARQQLGNGSITFINLPVEQNSNETRDLFAQVLTELMTTLQSPNSPNKPLELAYPSQLYDFTILWEFNLYKFVDLHNLLLCEGNILYSGDQKLDSADLLIEDSGLYVSSLTFTYDGRMESFSNISITRLKVLGAGSVFSHSLKMSLSKTPGLFSGVTTDGFETILSFTNAIIELEFELGTQTINVASNDANISIASTDSQSFKAYYPTIKTNGTVECSLQGGFPQNDGFFYALPHSSNNFTEFVPVSLNGAFRTNTLYSSGILLLNLTEAEDLSGKIEFTALGLGK